MLFPSPRCSGHNIRLNCHVRLKNSLESDSCARQEIGIDTPIKPYNLEISDHRNDDLFALFQLLFTAESDHNCREGIVCCQSSYIHYIFTVTVVLWADYTRGTSADLDNRD